LNSTELASSADVQSVALTTLPRRSFVMPHVSEAVTLRLKKSGGPLGLGLTGAPPPPLPTSRMRDRGTACSSSPSSYVMPYTTSPRLAAVGSSATEPILPG